MSIIYTERSGGYRPKEVKVEVNPNTQEPYEVFPASPAGKREPTIYIKNHLRPIEGKTIEPSLN